MKASLKNKMIAGTALAAALLTGYARRGYAACSNMGGGNYLCDGYSSTQQSVYIPGNLNAYTGYNFVVSAPAGHGLQLASQQSVTFTDTHASSMTGAEGGLLVASGVYASITSNGDIIGTDSGSRGIYVLEFAAGGAGGTNIEITGGTVQGESNGIYAKAKYGGDITIGTDASSHVTGVNSSGIRANTYGGAVNVTINGDVSSGKHGLVLQGSNDMSIITGSDSAITASNYGIYATPDGAGAFYANINGDIQSQQDGVKIIARNGDGFEFRTGADSLIQTDGEGIDLSNVNSGDMYVRLDGDITNYGAYNRAIWLMNNPYSNNFSLVIGANSSINTDYKGFEVYNLSVGRTDVKLYGDITSGRYGGFIRSYGTDLYFINHGSIASGLGFGASAIHYGAGDMDFIVKGSITSDHDLAVGLFKQAGGDITFASTGGSNISGYTYGLWAVQRASGKLDITIGGDVSSVTDDGIYAYNVAGTDLSIDIQNGGSVSSSYGYGIRTFNTYGTLSITSDGEIKGGHRGISIVNHGSDIMIDLNDHSITEADYVGLRARNYGTGAISINVDGYIAGERGLYTNNNGTDTTLIAGASSHITGGVYNALAAYNSYGILDLQLNGIASSRYSSAVTALNRGTDTKISIGAQARISSDYSEGLFINHRASGDFTMTVDGEITAYYAALNITSRAAAAANITINDTARLASDNGQGLLLHHRANNLSIMHHGIITGQIGIEMLNLGSYTGTIVTDGIIEGTGGTAILFSDDGAGNSYSTAATEVDIAGGRIIGNVVDNARPQGFSRVTVTGDFTSEGDFLVSGFNVGATGDFKLGYNNEIKTEDTVNIDGVFTFAGNNGYIYADNVINAGTINVNATGNHIYGDLQNSGTLNIATGRNFYVSTMSAGTGDIWFGFDTAANHAQLTVTDGAADLTGQTLHIDVTGVTGLADNEQALLIRSQGAIIGGPGGTRTAVDDNSVLWDFNIVDGTNAITPTGDNELFLIAYQSASVGYLATTQNNENAGNVLMTLQATTNPELSDIVANMNAAPDQAAFNEVLESVQPVADMSDTHVMNSFTHRNMDATASRLHDLRKFDDTEETTASLRDTGEAIRVPKGLQTWAYSFGDTDNAKRTHGLDRISAHQNFGVNGGYMKQARRSGIDGFDAASGGALFGIDTGRSFNDKTFGVAFSYGHTEIDSKNANNAQTDINGFQILGYATKLLSRDGYIDLFASYAQNSNNTTRYNVGGVPGLTAEGDFTSRQYGLRSSLGRHITHGDYTLTPNFSFDWLHYTADDYTETGAGGANLDVETKNLDNVELGAAIRVERKFSRDDGSAIAPEIHAGYFYNLTGDPLQKTAAFTGGGPAFTTESPDPARSRGTAGFGVTYHGAGNWDYALKYDLSAQNDLQEHNLTLRASLKF